jgi:YbbR domain-containing protein
MILALVMAVVVWVAAESAEDPIVQAELGEPIPIEVQNLPPDTILEEDWQQSARVRLIGPTSMWNDLSADDIQVTINLSPEGQPLEPGVHRLTVNVELNAERVQVLDVEPSTVEVELEAIRERVVPVSVELRGEPDLGYDAGTPSVDPETVQVRGPASQVDQVSQVMTNLSLQGARENLEQDLENLIPVGPDGNRVTGVTLTPSAVTVRVPLQQQPNFRQLPVQVEILGKPDPDYRVTNVRINPSTVNVIGSPLLLEDLPGIVSTVPISIEGRTEDVVERLPLELPPGVATVDQDNWAVQVTIDIEPFIDSVSVTRTVTYQGLSPGLAAVASPDVVEVLVSGPRPRLSNLLPEDVRVIVDVSGLRLSQTEQLTPVVVAPEGVVVDSLIPELVQVRIVREPTPTPTPTPGP